jgi:hypothetical protein
LGIATWLGVRYYRNRVQAKREDKRGAAFLSVRGLVKESESSDMSAINGPAFSRHQMSPSVVLPNRALITPKISTPDDILQHHQESGTLPRPFSFALSAAASPALRSPKFISREYDELTRPPTFLSSNASFNRFSVLSTSSTSSVHSSGHTRKVRQLFDPVLPDELLITNVGERLTIVQSFDDGWCVVGRESSPIIRAATAARSLFKSSNGGAAADLDVELGVVPAWCFLKPVKGLRAERPVRGSSLGITVQLEDPGFSSRDELLSWSNF